MTFFKRSLVGSLLLLVIAGCGAGPNFFPGITFTSATPVSSELLLNISKVAEETGFEVDSNVLAQDTRYVYRHVVFRQKGQQFPAIAVETLKNDGKTTISIWDERESGTTFSPRSAAVVKKFAASLNIKLPGTFTANSPLPP